MTDIMNIDQRLLIALLLTMVLVVCFGVMLFTDFRATLGRQYRVRVHCPLADRSATIAVDERLRYGRFTRTVRRCSIGELHEGCDEDCLDELGRRSA